MYARSVKNFEGKVAWVTGASSGIGRASALELSGRGACVAVSARREDRLDDVVADIQSRGGRAMSVPCDVTNEESQRAAAAVIAGAWGGIDLAFANAGCTVGGTIEELSQGDWSHILNVNVIGAALTARIALPHLMKRQGRVALTGSVAGFMAAPGWGAYHASKYALRAIGQTLSAELSGTGVSCTTVHPGFVASEIMKVGDKGFDASLPDDRPSNLMWTAEDAARVIVDAVTARKREFVFTVHGKVAVWLGMHFPSAMHMVMARGPMAEKSAHLRS